MALLNKIQSDIKSHTNEYVLALLMALFVLFQVQVPNMVADLVDTMVGKVALYSLAAVLLFRHPILGVVSLYFVYELIKRCEEVTGTYQIRQYEPSQQKRDKLIREANHVPKTLEEEVVNTMIPFADYDDVEPTSYLPVSEKLHGATKL